jgi:hypothetical protein
MTCAFWISLFSPSKAKHLAANVMPMTSMPGLEYLWEIWHSKMGLLCLCTFESIFHFHKQSKHGRDSKKWDSNLARAPQLTIQLAHGG